MDNAGINHLLDFLHTYPHLLPEAERLNKSEAHADLRAADGHPCMVCGDTAGVAILVTVTSPPLAPFLRAARSYRWFDACLKCNIAVQTCLNERRRQRTARRAS